MSRDWRRSAYLNRGKWPDAIPNTGPKREYGPYPWGRITHDDPHDLDTYPSSHPNAASVGDAYMGDVCPRCGVPLKWTEEVVLITGRSGVFGEVDDVDDPTPAYHPECWKDREAERKQIHNQTLTEFLP